MTISQDTTLHTEGYPQPLPEDAYMITSLLDQRALIEQRALFNRRMLKVQYVVITVVIAIEIFGVIIPLLMNMCGA